MHWTADSDFDYLPSNQAQQALVAVTGCYLWIDVLRRRFTLGFDRPWEIQTYDIWTWLSPFVLGAFGFLAAALSITIRYHIILGYKTYDEYLQGEKRKGEMRAEAWRQKAEEWRKRPWQQRLKEWALQIWRGEYP